MEIYVQRGEERIGPLSPEQVSESLSNGTFQGNELAWHSGLSDWVSVSTVLDTLPNAGNTTTQIQQHTFNVTGCIFTIQPRQTEIRQGDTIGFDVTVTCGEKRVIADEIYISLMEIKTVRAHDRLVTKSRNLDKKSWHQISQWKPANPIALNSRKNFLMPVCYPMAKKLRAIY